MSRQEQSGGRKKRWWLWRWLGRGYRVVRLVFLLSLTCAIVYGLYTNYRGKQAADRVIAEMKKRGLETSAAALHETEAGDPVATAKWRLARALVVMPDPYPPELPVFGEWEHGVFFGVPMTDVQGKALAKALAPNEAFFEKLDEALANPDVELEMMFDSMLVPFNTTTELRHLRDACRMLELRAYYHESRGEPEAAADDCAAQLKVCRLMDHNHYLITELVRMSVSANAWQTLESLLSRREVASETLLALAPRFEAESEAIDHKRAIEWELTLLAGPMREVDAYVAVLGYTEHHYDRTETLAANPTNNQSDRRRWWTDARVRAARIWYTAFPGEWQSELARQAETALQIHDQAPLDTGELNTWRNNPEAEANASMLAAAEAIMRNRAGLRATAVAMHVEAYRMEHGRWPAALSDLGIDIPDDPFTGKPLLYRQSPDGVVVYSVGDDLSDDGGNVEERLDVGFRLLDPDKRGKLAAPPDPLDDFEDADDGEVDGLPDEDAYEEG